VTAPTASSPRRSRIVGHADVPPAELVPNPRNWRTHPDDQQQALSGALAEVGWVAEVTVNRTTGHVVDGHLRIELALSRHEPRVPVTCQNIAQRVDEEDRKPDDQGSHARDRRPPCRPERLFHGGKDHAGGSGFAGDAADAGIRWY
jgi:hypothetical protein